MAQSRPTTTTDGGKALAKTIVDLQRRVRTLELREDPTPTGGGGSGAWMEIDHNSGWVDASSFSSFAQIGDVSIWEQSGGFSVVDSQTLSLPDGVYVVEWSFDFWFPFTNPYGGGYFGDGWALWRGGVIDIPDTVRIFTNFDEQMLTPVFFEDDGGGDAAVNNTGGKANGLAVWRGMVKAGGSDGNNLSLGILDFYDFFPSALDWSADFNANLQTAANGSGNHNVWIGSVGS